MPRRIIYKVKDLSLARANYWALHYQARAYATASRLDPLKILNALAAVGMPDPEMEIDGSLYEPFDVLHAQRAAVEWLGYGQVSIEFQKNMCAWYWTEGNWTHFVEQFNALPNLTEDYYLQYDSERDGGRLVPMSLKPKRNVPAPVDKPVHKSGTSQVQVPVSRYKSEVLAGGGRVGG